MFVFSFKASTLKYVGVMVFCALAIVMTVVLVPSDKTVGGTGVAETSVSSSGDLSEKIKSYGWETTDDPISVTEVVIPESFNGIYEEYNELQRSAGMDLTKYKGKKAELHTYGVEGDGEVDRINVLVYKGKIIGGDVSSASAEGPMYSLKGKQSP